MNDNAITFAISHPFQEDQQLVIQTAKGGKNSSILQAIDLSKLEITGDLAEITTKIGKTNQQMLRITFELTKSTEDQAADETHYKFDFSATSLKLKKKLFSVLKSGPLLSFYEILTTSGKSVYESDISKIATCDPFWTITKPIPHSQLSPTFIVNIYQSIDNEKSKKVVVASLNINFEDIIGPEKETMFEVPGTDGKTIFMLDRIQEFPPSLKHQ